MIRAAAALAVLLGARVASAQPAPAAPPPPPPRADLRSDDAIARELASITQDPAIVVDGPKIRAVAQALMVAGVKQLEAKAYAQALADFLEAYAKFPSPRILLNIASTLRDMDRAADAANTYARFLLDPHATADRIAEVQRLLAELDAKLTTLTVTVSPHGAELSLDGGPWLAVGSTLVTRVDAGDHALRIRHDSRSAALALTGAAGERRALTAALPELAPAPTPSPSATPAPAAPAPASPPPPEQVNAWLTTGTRYAASGDNARRVRVGDRGDELPPAFRFADLEPPPPPPPDPQDEIDSGALAMLRIDGKGRGVAAGFGVELAAAQHLDLELAVLRSNQWGAYAGGRYRVLTGLVRPYVAVGVPAFFYDDDLQPTNPTELAVGVRAAAGVELRVNGHLSIHGDVGYEHFFHLSGTAFDANLLVPTLAAVGRL